MDIQYNPAFLPFFKCEKRYAVVKGGAGSGKSHGIAQKGITRCLDEVHRWLVIRKVKNTIRGSVFQNIKDQLSDYGLIDKGYVNANNTELSFKFSNGSEIITTGLDDVEKLKSIANITMVWIEEATEIAQADFEQIDLRLRGETPFYKQIMLSFNPISADHWLKARFFDEPCPMTFTHHSTYKDNFFLDAQYIKTLETSHNKNPNMKRIYVDGEWGRVITNQEFYKSFKYEKHVKPTAYNPELALHLSFDFNVNPYMPLSIWQIEQVDGIFKCYNIDEIIAKNPINDTESVCDAFIEKYKQTQAYIYGDASGKVSSTASKIHNYDIIEQVLHDYLNNYSFRVPKRNPLIAKRRGFVNGCLDGNYSIEVIIDPNCKFMIADLENVLESPDGGKHKQMAKDPISKIPYEKYGHLSDCFDYFFCGAFERLYTDFQKK